MTNSTIIEHGTRVPNGLDRLSGGAIETDSYLVKIGSEPCYYQNKNGWTPDTSDAVLLQKKQASEQAEATRDRPGSFRNAPYASARIVVAINR